jgi:hypothetical protein
LRGFGGVGSHFKFYIWELVAIIVFNGINIVCDEIIGDFGKKEGKSKKSGRVMRRQSTEHRFWGWVAVVGLSNISTYTTLLTK